MKCEICHKGEATTVYTHVVDDIKKTLFLCPNCLPDTLNKEPEQGESKDNDVDFQDKNTSETKEVPHLVKKIKVEFLSKSEGENVSNEKCSACGMDYEEFKKEGRFGCKECYITFQSRLTRLLKRIHGAEEHLGKSWERGEQLDISFEDQLVELNKALRQAVEKEQFERAAQLRDEIRVINDLIEKENKDVN